jgi:hypothetical protein
MMNTRSESGAAPACAQRSVSPDHPTAGNYKEKSTMKRTLWTMAAIALLAICRIRDTAELERVNEGPILFLGRARCWSGP